MSDRDDTRHLLAQKGERADRLAEFRSPAEKTRLLTTLTEDMPDTLPGEPAESWWRRVRQARSVPAAPTAVIIEFAAYQRRLGRTLTERTIGRVAYGASVDFRSRLPERIISKDGFLFIRYAQANGRIEVDLETAGLAALAFYRNKELQLAWGDPTRRITVPQSIRLKVKLDGTGVASLSLPDTEQVRAVLDHVAVFEIE